VESVKRMIAEHRAADGSITDKYLAALSVAYEELAPRGRGVSIALARALDIATTTLKGHLVRAREDGYLSKAVPGREGGEATDKARKLLAAT
jgi:hypothetical protein